MIARTTIQHNLIDVGDSILVVIDVQQTFIDKLPPDESEALVQRICWLVQVARGLAVPLVVTAEEIPALGGIVPELAEKLPADTAVFNKMTFGLAAQPDIVATIAQTGRRTAILVGLETDVCVTHSALGLQEAGYQVAVLADATGSPGSAHDFGLARMREAGVTVSTIKGLYYEWVRTVERNNQFIQNYRDSLGQPPVGL